MTQRKLLIPAGICLLTFALLIILISSRNNDGASEPDSSAENAPNSVSSQASPAQETVSETKREREDPEAAIARRNLEKEFDEILPAKYPDQFSSLCDVTLKLGESLILGGFKRSDSNHEFIRMTVTLLDAGNGRNQYSISAKSMILTPEKSAEMGFDTLISPAKTKIQQSRIVNPQDIDLTGDGVNTSLNSTLVINANSPASISSGNAEGALVISTMVSAQSDGESIRLRTRIESPDGLP